jgi:RNA polymerase sigma-70 factor (ECF subfamily)
VDSRTILVEIPRLRRYARAMLGNRAAADDLVQDTLERAWARLSQWRAGSDLRAWLFSIMHNLRVDQLRRPSVSTQSMSMDEREFGHFEAATRATQADELEVSDLESALNQLPDEQREVLLLVALEEMSYAEIAETLAVPVGTVMSRLSRGRERLRQVMDGRPSSARLKVVR